MHGRLKTRTTEEQEKIKKQERAKKVETYKKSMGMLTEMRKSNSCEKSAIDIAANILLKNPDIITVWNYRREMFLNLRNQLNDDDDEYQKLLEGDLSLTEQCLRVNPKSYGSWHHRVWVLSNMPKPTWERELTLCKRYLELDERNFHCWDYRRFVTQMAEVSDESEYEYTLEKIKANFSNYSAWHLRSKLLPKIFPDEENNLPISESKHKEELELVQNAAFTDPNDQSAWFYQRWLLGLTEPKTHFISIIAKDDEIAIAVSKNLKQNDNVRCGSFIKVEINGESIDRVWKCTSNGPQSTLWILHLESKVTNSDRITICLEESGIQYNKVELNEVNGLKYVLKEPIFIANFSPSLKEVLAEELSNSNQLLELEPDSKWTFLTRLLLMEAIDAIKYEQDIENSFKKLIEIDHLRSGYYHDLCSKFIIECSIRHYHLSQRPFNLSGQNLTCLYHMQYLSLLEEVDLSSNALSSETLASLHCLLNCTKLNLENNKIKTLKFLPLLPKLAVLNLKSNMLEDSSSNYLEKFPSLQEVSL